MNKKIFYVVAVALVVLAGYSFIKSKKNVAEIKGHKFNFELAVSQEERERGLSGKDELCQNCGMLFVFPKSGKYNFWMRDMRFGLDIIWINEGKIVYIEKNVALSDQRVLSSQKNADLVLEINAGLSDKYGISPGDEVKIYY